MNGRAWNSTLPASPGPKRKTRIKPKKRSPANFARIYHSVERVAFVQALPCVAAGPSTRCIGAIANAHVKVDGMSRKAGYHLIVPACHRHHDALHRWGVRSFEAFFAIDLMAQAASVQAAWERASG